MSGNQDQQNSNQQEQTENTYPYDLNLKGKKAVVLGVANQRSIAWAIAKALDQCGVQVALNYQNERLGKWVLPLAQTLQSPLCLPCDLNDHTQVKTFFETIQQEMGEIDFLIHSVAFARIDDLKAPLWQIDLEGFEIAMKSSAYSLIEVIKFAYPIMKTQGAVIAMSYLGAHRAVPNYGIMGPAKAALEAEIRYLAVELGEKGIRVNGISAGPIKTLAAAGIPQFREMLAKVAEMSPIRRNVTQEEVANTAMFLLSPLSSGITGQVIYVDGGVSVVGG